MPDPFKVGDLVVSRSTYMSPNKAAVLQVISVPPSRPDFFFARYAMLWPESSEQQWMLGETLLGNQRTSDYMLVPELVLLARIANGEPFAPLLNDE